MANLFMEVLFLLVKYLLVLPQCFNLLSYLIGHWVTVLICELCIIHHCTQQPSCSLLLCLRLHDVIQCEILYTNAMEEVRQDLWNKGVYKVTVLEENQLKLKFHAQMFKKSRKQQSKTCIQRFYRLYSIPIREKPLDVSIP